MRKLACLFLVVTLYLAYSCGSNEFETDISDVAIAPVKFKRLDVDLFEVDTNQIVQHSRVLTKKYGTFYNKFIVSVFQNAGIKDSMYSADLKKFTGDKDMRGIYSMIKSAYSEKDIESLEEAATVALQRAKKLFPDTVLPAQFVLMSSGLSYRNVNIDSTMAVCLDFYLGKDAVYYNMLQTPIPVYKKRLMEKEYILRDMLMSWVLFKFDLNEPEKNLLESMIEAGKFYYCTKRLAPEMEDSLLFGYTSKQMEYCGQYEKDLWRYFSEKNRLYINDMKEILAYNSDGPFTAAISKDCPPGIARYIGYRIVCAYMKNNKNVKLPALMADNEFQKIMLKSKYKP